MSVSLRNNNRTTVKGLSDTRWYAREDACRSLCENWESIIEALNFYQNDQCEKPLVRNEACGILNGVSGVNNTPQPHRAGGEAQQCRGRRRARSALYYRLPPLAQFCASLAHLINNNSFQPTIRYTDYHSDLIFRFKLFLSLFQEIPFFFFCGNEFSRIFALFDLRSACLRRRALRFSQAVI